MGLSKKKVVVGMSGGVDSSVTLILLKKMGYQPIGVTLKLPVWEKALNNQKENICCIKESIDLAKEVCKKMNVPHIVLDTRKEFYNTVVNYFKKTIEKGKTPNPCVFCNRYFKFTQLLNFANKHKIYYITTGHYARILFNPKTKETELFRAKDKSKDQSYNLSFLNQKILKRLILPLGKYYKKKVYKIAENEGFSIFYQKPQSQDFCYVPHKSLNLFIKETFKPKEGLIIDKNNNVLGKHPGLYFFTLGQRKGLNLANGPFYVYNFNWKKNILIVTKNKKDLFKKEIIVSPVNFISRKPVLKKNSVKVKTRSQQKLIPAVLIPIKKNKYKLIFKKPVFAPTPGQVAVFYQNERCLGGGIINIIN